MVLAIVSETGTTAAELSAWLMLLGGAAVLAFAVSLIFYLSGIIFHSDVVIRNGASRPGRVDVSEQKVAALLKAFGEKKGILADDMLMIKDIAMNGDSQSAIVVCTSPLLVAAYSEDMDCVAMLRFPQSLIEPYALERGTRLLSTNVYTPGSRCAPDLILPAGVMTFANLHPVIVDFISNSAATIDARKAEVPESHWLRAEELAAEYLLYQPNVCRSGDPRKSYIAGRRPT